MSIYVKLFGILMDEHLSSKHHSTELCKQNVLKLQDFFQSETLDLLEERYSMVLETSVSMTYDLAS